MTKATRNTETAPEVDTTTEAENAGVQKSVDVLTHEEAENLTLTEVIQQSVDGTTTNNSSNPTEGDAPLGLSAVNKAPKDFKFSGATVARLMAQLLGISQGKVSQGKSYNIWALKCIRKSAKDFQQSYIINPKGEIYEIPQGIDQGTYYEEIREGVLAVAYHGVTGQTEFTTVKLYLGSELPEMGTGDQQSEGFAW